MKSKVTAMLIGLVVFALGQFSYAETLPQGFPFAACPSGTLIESFSSDVNQIVEYKTPQSAAQISQFYTQDLK